MSTTVETVLEGQLIWKRREREERRRKEGEVEGGERLSTIIVPS